MQDNRKALRHMLESGGESGGGERMFQSDTIIPAKQEFVSVLEKKRKEKGSLIAAIHADVTYEPFVKNFYVEVPQIAAMSDAEVASLRTELENVRIRGKDCPKPIRRFAQAGLSDRTLAVMAKLQFFNPTPIQAQALPAIMSGRDVIAIAKTGSGKTLAFVLPMLRHVAAQRPVGAHEGPIALVMAPTRELATQIHAVVRKFASANEARSVCAYGGTNVASQIGVLKGGAEIVVCTPGRMIDLLTLNAGRVVNLTRLTMLILDEADRMFDMGFEPQIMRIVDSTREDRQTVMFSATFPPQMEALARKVLQNPLQIIVGGRVKVSSTVDQHVLFAEDEDGKFAQLLEIVRAWLEQGAVIVFVERQDKADAMFRDLLSHGVSADSLHSGKDQADRSSTLADFKAGRTAVLIATSLASRGLDVKDLNCVVNFDVPSHLEDYVHRVGRTGRAGNKGVAYTLVGPEEEDHLPWLAKALSSNGAAVPKDVEERLASYRAKKAAGLFTGPRRVPGGSYAGRGFTYAADEKNATDEALRRARRVELGEDVAEPAAAADSAPEASAKALEAKKKRGHISKLDLVNAALTRLSSTPTSGLHNTIKGTAAAGEENVLFENGIYSMELPVNDYPQRARWLVTKKEGLYDILEETDCAATTRGNFVPEGRNPKPGERKLYMVIEGKDRLNVVRCHRLVRDKLEELAAAEGPRSTDAYAKYSVL